ncbi:nucleoside deaminase [Salinibacterium amurskyense]|uniref:nucleoside deaminase n=1 Tax=Salinibacterium amurskyense TaxID=205941 RepID=UPI00311D6430
MTAADRPSQITNAMRAALELSADAITAGEFPYGAVVIDAYGVIVGRAHDRVETDDDLTSHAEILAVQDAVRNHGRSLAGCTLVSGVEPCAMCFSAAWTAGVEHLVFGLSMSEMLQLRPDALDEISIDSVALSALTERRISVTSGVLADECRTLWAR